MLTTMKLLDEALKQQTASDWARDLGLHRNALNNAKNRGHLSPAIAGALAEKMGADPEEWIVLAALESERDSACKTRMMKRVTARVRLEALAGMQDKAIRVLMEGMADALSESIPKEAATKEALKAILSAFPEDQPKITAAPAKTSASARGVAADRSRLRKSLRT
jgi:plasmid maintenance system antidote protein VapI